MHPREGIGSRCGAAMQGLGPGCPPAGNVTLTVFPAVVNLPPPPKTGAGFWRPRVGWAEGEFPARLPSPGKAKNAPCRAETAQRSGLAVAGISGAAPRIPPFQEWLLLPACPSRMTRAQRPLIAANMAHMAAAAACSRRQPTAFLPAHFLPAHASRPIAWGVAARANLAAFVRRRQASEPSARLEPQDMN
jgi:hypothetical protein